jgi:hypothetical protein
MPRPGTIDDEALVPPYELPSLLASSSSSHAASIIGTTSSIDTAAAWGTRRAELLELFRTHVYGHTPMGGVRASHKVLSSVGAALSGRAVRREIRLTLRGLATQQLRSWTVLLYLPSGASAQNPAPAFLGLNFSGNHTVHADPGITESVVCEPNFAGKARGEMAERWCVEQVVQRGFALCTVYSGEIEPDRPDTAFSHGVHALFDFHDDSAPPESWGTIAAWAWGLSRTLDLLEAAVPEVDATRVAVIGHSRKGKAALWAGAEDPRFALVISNNSGCGGAALSRRAFGETVAVITTSFPTWFCSQFKQCAHATTTHASPH